jgi:uncharacterized phage protein gp47/JayE
VDDGGQAPNYDTMVKILNDIESYRGGGTVVLLAAPETKFVDVTLSVILDEDADAEETRDAIVENVSEYMSRLGLGQRFYRNRLIAAILSVPTIKNVEILSPSADQTDVAPGQVVRLNNLEIRQVREIVGDDN